METSSKRMENPIYPTPTSLTAKMLSGAQQAARIAFVKRYKRELNVQEKTSSIDLVSDADKASQVYLKENLPHTNGIGVKIGFKGEEQIAGLAEEAQGPFTKRWMVDPIDGTKPFTEGQPHWSVSIALQEKTNAATRHTQEGRAWESTNAVIYCSSSEDCIKGASKNKPVNELSAEDVELHGKLYWAEKGKGTHVTDLAQGWGRSMPYRKPERIEPVVEFETIPESNKSEAQAYARGAAIVLGTHGMKPDWRRSICYAGIEVLEGKKAAVVQGPGGPYDWDIGALSLIVKEAGLHATYGKGVKDDKGEPRYHAVITWDKGLFDQLSSSVRKPPVIRVNAL